MMRVSKLFLLITLGATVAVAACKKDDAAKDETEDETATNDEPEGDTEKPAEDPSAEGATSAAAVHDVMKPYEQCRSLLAEDEVDGIAECAGAVSAAAKAAAEEASDDAEKALAEVAAAADALAGAPADDIEKVRLAFGEVSEPIVALLTAVPDAAKDYHVFECPMAKGYKRWAQPDAELANPYMGQEMLACGSEIHDHHQGMMKHGHMMDGDDESGMDHDMKAH